MEDDDRGLLERIRRGDGEAFGVLYDRTRDYLLSCVIVPRVGRTDADDVLSETFRTALTKVQDFEWRGIPPLHWLATIARRKCLEAMRRHRSRAGSTECLPELCDLPDEVPTAEAAIIALESKRLVKERIETTLRDLPTRYADALRLRLIENRSRADCASRLAVSVATFDVVLYRATRAFAKKWRAALPRAVEKTPLALAASLVRGTV